MIFAVTVNENRRERGKRVVAYIKRNLLLADIFDAMVTNKLESSRTVLKKFEETVMNQPTADVVEVRRGEWIYHERVASHEGAISGYSCSECCSFIDEDVFDMDGFHKVFCGNCGARMDGTTQKEG